MDRQERTFEIDMEVRALENSAPLISGYAVVFNSWSEVMLDSRGRPFRERFAPGAFDRVLAGNPDVRALWAHDQTRPLGRTRNGSLRLRKDAQGLRFEIEPPDTTWGADAVTSIRRGDVSGMSFAFAVQREGGDAWEKPGADGISHRTITDADLFEVSPVTFPAYPATQVMVRSVSVPDFESESDGQAADDDIGERDADRAVSAARLQHEMDILRRR